MTDAAAAPADGVPAGVPAGDPTPAAGLTGLSEDYLGNEGLKDFKDVNGLAKAYLDTKSMVGRSIQVPGDDAGNDDWDKFYGSISDKTGNRVMPRPNGENAEAMKGLYAAMGRPEDVGGYDIPDIDGAQIDDGRRDMLRGLAHDAGLSNEQFSKVLGGVLQSDVDAQAQHDLSVKEGVQALQSELGFAYDGKMKGAEHIKNTFFKFIDIPLEQMGAESARAFIELADAFGSEANGVVADKGMQQGTLSPSQAQEKISEIMNNKEHPYWKPDDPANNVARAKMRELHKLVAFNEREDVITLG